MQIIIIFISSLDLSVSCTHTTDSEAHRMILLFIIFPDFFIFLNFYELIDLQISL